MKPISHRAESGIGATCKNNLATGLAGQALIMTRDGERRVRDLAPAARVITRDSGTAILRDLRSRRMTGAVVRIRAGSLGHRRPEGDAVLPAGQPVLLRDWRARALYGAAQVLVPVHRLVDGEFVTLHPGVTMTVFELRFDRPHVLYVDGLEVSSHLDDPARHLCA